VIAWRPFRPSDASCDLVWVGRCGPQGPHRVPALAIDQAKKTEGVGEIPEVRAEAQTPVSPTPSVVVPEPALPTAVALRSPLFDDRRPV
jgi:hypothetical protein